MVILRDGAELVIWVDLLRRYDGEDGTIEGCFLDVAEYVMTRTPGSRAQRGQLRLDSSPTFVLAQVHQALSTCSDLEA
jgi:hypothetical protein